MSSPEVLRSKPEYEADVAIDRDWCLRSLISQARDRQIDPVTDEYLIEQINESHVDSTDAGDITECQIGGCALICLTNSESGILELRAERGNALCDPEQD